MALDAAMPQIPPALAALFAQRMNATQTPGAPGSPAITPPAMTGGPAAPMRNVFGMPQGTGMFQQPAVKPAPAPTDDPAVSGNSGLPTLPDMSALTNERQKASDIESKIASIKQPLPEDYKPSWWRRLLSIPLATAAGLNNPAAGAEASDTVLYGPYHRAQSQYEAQISPLQKQLEYERSVGVPMAESEARLGQERFTNEMSLTREKREQTAFENETGDKIFQETGPDNQTHYYQTTKGGQKREVPEPKAQADDRRKREEDENSPAPNARPEPDPAAKGKWRIKTKSGAYVPYTPKNIDEGAMLGDKRSTDLFHEEHRDKSAENANANGYTPSEQREITTKQRPIQRQMDALDKQKEAYMKQRAAVVSIKDTAFGKKQLANLDAEIAEIETKRQPMQDKLDAIEDEVASRRPIKGASGAGGGGSFRIPAGAPPAKGVPDGHQLKQNGKVIAVAKAGQWVAP